MPAARPPRSRAEPGAPATGRAGLVRHPGARARVAAAPDVLPPPAVRLGRSRANGLAPALSALLERGVQLHPSIAVRVRGKIVFRYHEGYTPTRVSFGHSLRGLVALARMARGRVVVSGDRTLARRLLRLLALDA